MKKNFFFFVSGDNYDNTVETDVAANDNTVRLYKCINC